jgi:hypothetical protein
MRCNVSPSALPVIVSALLLVACTSHSSTLLHRTGVLDNLQAEAPVTSAVTYHTLAVRAKTIADPVISAAANAIAQDAALDSVASSGDPHVAVGVGFGRSLVQGGGAHLNEGIDWNLINYYQRIKINTLLPRIDRAHRLLHEVAQREALIIFNRLYFNYAQNVLEAKLAVEDLKQAEQELSIRELGFSASTHDFDGLSKARLRVATMSRELAVGDARVEASRRELLYFCHVAPDATVQLQEPLPPPDVSTEGFRSYLDNALASSGTVFAENMKLEISQTIARMQAISRWTNFHINTDFLDLFNGPFGLLSAPVGWTFELLDQGRFNRMMVRDQLDVVLARLAISKAADDAIREAADAWTGVQEAEVRYMKQQRRVNELQIVQWKSEYLLGNDQIGEMADHKNTLAFEQAESELKSDLFSLVIAYAAYTQFEGQEWYPVMLPPTGK